MHSETSAGGVVVRQGPSGPEVALATQQDRNLARRTVRLPKGHLEPGETPEQAALREVLEETGLEAEIVAALPTVSYRYVEKRRGRSVEKRVHFYLMRQTGGTLRPADGEFEQTFWCATSTATTKLTFETEQQVVREACRLLEIAHAAD